jgi:hypothetical protein
MLEGGVRNDPQVPYFHAFTFQSDTGSVLKLVDPY